MKVLNKYHYNNKVPEGAINIMRGSIFGNPFIIGDHGTREEVIEKYRQWLWTMIQEDPEFYYEVKNLQGKDLCCCCAPKPCHGDILVRACEYLNREK